MTLPNSGTFSYNGVAFVSLYKSKVEVRPVKDSAGRALSSREYILDVEGRVAAALGSTTDATLTTMRRLLEMPAGALMYTGKGYGSLSINVPGGALKDAAYGPWPDVLTWDPIGNDQGCIVRWKCKTLVPCEEDPNLKGVIEFCWGEDWAIDQDGYTTRTIVGHLTIQATRTSSTSRTIPDNADAYRNKVVPDLPTGFKRTQDYSLSEDKRTLNFHVTDEEIPLPLPSGVSSADVRHKVVWRRPQKGSANMTSSLSGTITLPARTPKSFIWDKILLIMQSRWPLSSAAKGGGKGAPGPAAAAGMDVAAIAVAAAIAAAGGKAPPAARPAAPTSFTYMLDSIEIDDELFGRSSSFSASCRIFGPASQPGSLLSASGLWTAIAGTDFVSWRGSIFQRTDAGKALAPRGMADMRFQNNDDAIVDMCSRQNVPQILQPAPGRLQSLRTRLQRTQNGKDLDPRNTWIQYRLRLRLIENDRIARHKPLNGSITTRPVQPLEGFITDGGQSANLSSGFKPPQPNEIGGFISPPPSATESIMPQGPGATTTVPDILQRVSTPNYTIRLEGYAERIAFPIPTPRIKSIGGVAVTQLREDVAQEQLGAIGALPIYAASWIVDYALPRCAKAQLPMPINDAMI